MGSKTVARIMSFSLALILSAMLCPTLTFGAVGVEKESVSGPLDRVDFGEVAVGSTSQEILVVTNTNGEAIDLRFTLSHGDSCKITLLTDSTFIGVGVGNFVNVTLEYEPSAEQACSGSLYIVYTGQTSNSTDFTILPLIGIGGPEDIPGNPVGTVFIDSRDTGVEDKEFKDKLISEWLEQCAVEAKSHRHYVWRVRKVTKKMRMAGLITKEEKQAICKRAREAKIPAIAIALSDRGTIMISGRDTGLKDQEYDGYLISEWLKECADEAENHRAFVKSVSKLVIEMKKKGHITGKQKHAVRKQALRAKRIVKQCRK